MHANLKAMLQKGTKAFHFECFDENGIIMEAINMVETKNHTSQLL